LCQALRLFLLALATLSALAAGRRSRCGTRRRSGSLLLLLLALLLGLRVHWLDVEDNTIGVNIDLVVQLQSKDGRVLNEVDMSNNVVVSLLSSPLLSAPLRDDRRELLIDGDVGDGGLCAEQRGPAREVCVERRQALGGLCGILGGRGNVRGGDDPLAQLSFLRIAVGDLGEQGLRSLHSVGLGAGVVGRMGLEEG
jgi:hypothetical protein